MKYKIFLIIVLIFSFVKTFSQSFNQGGEQLKFIDSFFNTISNPCQKLTVKTYLSFFSNYKEFDNELFLLNNFNDCNREIYINYMSSGKVEPREYNGLFPSAEKMQSLYNIVLENSEIFDSQALNFLIKEIKKRKLVISSREFLSFSIYNENTRFIECSYKIKDKSGNSEVINIILDKKDNYKISDIKDTKGKSLLSPAVRSL